MIFQQAPLLTTFLSERSASYIVPTPPPPRPVRALARDTCGLSMMDDLVAVDPDAIRPVVKVQASDVHSRALDQSLGPTETTGATKRQLAPPLDAFVLSGVVSLEECARLRRCAEAANYSFWNAASSTSTFRNSDTVEITSTKVACELWERVKHLVVPRVTIAPNGEDETGTGAAAAAAAEKGAGEVNHKLWEPGLEGEWEAYGINAHLLFNRYGPGGHFSPHTDGATIVDMNRRSLYSMLVYLNQCPLECGGGTALFTPPEGTSMVRFGRTTIFWGGRGAGTPG